MAETLTTTISVRGEARRTVAPDQADISCAARSVAPTPSEARAQLSAVLEAVFDRLRATGGVVRTVESEHAPLTWSTHSISTSPEYGHLPGTNEHGPTGRHQADASINVTVRDFTLLGTVETSLSQAAGLDVQGVSWSVDHDNPDWAAVRADAIHAALRKGADYATALDGSIVNVEHIADAGLLTSSTNTQQAIEMSRRRAPMSAGTFGGETTSLDPVPQTIYAVIDARLAAVITFDGGSA